MSTKFGITGDGMIVDEDESKEGICLRIWRIIVGKSLWTGRKQG
jgi:hypothetical protein